MGAAIGSIAGWYLIKKARPRLVKNSVKILTSAIVSDKRVFLSFVCPLAAGTGFMWLQNSGYRFYVNEIWGANDLGLIVVALTIAGQFSGMVETLAMQYLSPYFYRKINDNSSKNNNSQALSDLMDILIPIYGLWTCLIIICSKAILQVLTGPSFHAAETFLMVFAFSEFLRCLTNISSNAAHATNKTIHLILPYFIGASILWFGVWCLDFYRLSFEYLRWVILISSGIVCILMAVRMKKIVNYKLNYSKLIFILFSILIAFILSKNLTKIGDGIFTSLLFISLNGVIFLIVIFLIMKKSKSLNRIITGSLN
jgi:hypothetical protein